MVWVVVWRWLADRGVSRVWWCRGAGSGGRGGVAVPRPAFGIGAGRRSGEGGDVSVGGEDVGGGGPSVEDADDVASGFTNDAGGCVPQLPAQPFGQRPGEGPGDTEQLEPADQVRSPAHDS